MTRLATTSRTAAWILAIAALFGGWSLQAAPLVPGAEVVLQGTVESVISRDSFWLKADGERVLVYQRSLPRRMLVTGQSVRVHGRVSDDWMRLADNEVTARRVETPLTAMR